MVPFLQQLDRERDEALVELEKALKGRRHRRLMKRLPQWLERPGFTPLGELPLKRWLYEWSVPISSGLFLHPGWFCRDPRGEDLHDLRKRIKGVRYALEHLEPFLDAEIRSWVNELKQAQDNLGDLHDLQVLGQTLAGHRPCLGPGRLPGLQAEITRQQEERWARWLGQAERMCRDDQRLRLHRHLACLGEGGERDRSPQEGSAAEASGSGQGLSIPH
jgi:CHAD domain-containing protein